MRRIIHLIALIASLAIITTLTTSPLMAQRRQSTSRERRAPRPHPPVRSGAVVFVGGYFYDPFFGPYPWWPRPLYPYAYDPIFEVRSIVRVIATPKDAAVYADGFYAGTVHDFNDFFQGLPLSPGGHEIVLFLDGYRTIDRRIYLAAGTTYKLREAMERLPEGEVSEPPALAPPIPPPPDGSFLHPRTPPRTPSASPPTTDAAADIGCGTLSLHVQPVNADLRIDGERWASSDGGSFVIQLRAGAHRLEVAKPGFRPYSDEILVDDRKTTSLNVSLSAK